MQPPSAIRPIIGRLTATLALVLMLALAGCGRREATGDYPAANGVDCLPNIALQDQNGKTVTLASLKGKPVLIDFIYTTCGSTCPTLTLKMSKVAGELGPELGQKVTIVSLTLDPEHDTPSELLKYSIGMGASSKGWLFLTGKPAQIDQVLALFKLVRTRESDGSITHATSAFLLGPNGRQVRQYNALDVAPETVAADVKAITG